MFNTVNFSSNSRVYGGGLEKSLAVMAVCGKRGIGNYTRIYNFEKNHPQPKSKITMEHLLTLFYLTTFR